MTFFHVAGWLAVETVLLFNPTRTRSVLLHADVTLPGTRLAGDLLPFVAATSAHAHVQDEQKQHEALKTVKKKNLAVEKRGKPGER